jgi:glucose-6-phosphate isomerase
MNALTTELGALTIGRDGSMLGATAGYQQVLGGMDGVYRDRLAYRRQLTDRGPDDLVYSVTEHRAGNDAGALIVGTSTLRPGSYGEEFAMTRGHLHAIADRAELYHCLAGHGVMLLESIAGDHRAVELVEGQAVHVPGHWVHRSVNVASVPFVTLFCYSADAGQNYELISRAGGMATLVVKDVAGWKTVPNPDHTGYQL